jgi:Asp-tRNA(Asn)/Glu-tRNA(Gln) amidotransferase A subunit family amidase
MPDTAERMRQKPLYCVLHALASGEVSSVELTRACLDAIARDSELNAWNYVDADAALAAAAESDARRAADTALGRLDGVPLAIKDNLDVVGMPTSVGLQSRRGRVATEDAFVIARLRGAGAVMLGKTGLDEAGFGTLGRNPHYGDVRNPRDAARVAGGSSAGSAVAVAAGHAIAAIGSDTLGSVRVPAAFCGVVGLRPTFGELSCRGLATSLRRLDCPGLMTRCVQDLTPLLQVMAGYDACDPRSRKRRVPLAPPDWAPGTLRAGIVAALPALGATAPVLARFERAVQIAMPLFGSAAPASLDIAPLDLTTTRRAALLLMEAEILAAHDGDLDGASARLNELLAFAQRKRASDFARADRQLDRHVVQVRALFEHFDVLLLPTTPVLPPLVGDDEPANLADFTAHASLAGCPALALPRLDGVGLQLVGAPGSDLRLIELGEMMSSVIDAEV